MCTCTCLQDEIRQLAKQVMEGKNRYEAVKSLRRKVSAGEWRRERGTSVCMKRKEART